eukprot:NODE_298_length_2123_cov_61.114729_g292_i0.p1 GENE.NODE_298_length_2123_cov_61.114729_g292_i0~~NODE_298_length_2123_cov_61.114729_g292_i0.p1  ORF type:complete len:683 (-),score=221.16 NODE_298_length_2123_cov_61.114729_g292_i0:75-1937(-)
MRPAGVEIPDISKDAATLQASVAATKKLTLEELAESLVDLPARKEMDPGTKVAQDKESTGDSGDMDIDADEEPPFYDVTMVKADVSDGSYGQNMFYRLQVLLQPHSPIVLVWTRWGRIGQEGQYQRTPFPTRAAAVAEFLKIFKAKTSNKWQDRADFQRAPGKWRLVDKLPHTKQVAHTDSTELLQHFPELYMDDESKLPKEVQMAYRMFSCMKMLRGELNRTGVDPACMPFGRLDRDAILRGKAILLKMRDVIRETVKLQQEKNVEDIAARNETKLQLREQIIVLNNEFYEQVPTSAAAYGRLVQMDAESDVNEQLGKLESLLDLETASKMLLGAKQRTIEARKAAGIPEPDYKLHARDPTKEKIRIAPGGHPWDYLAAATGVTMEPLHNKSEEYSMIATYLHSTRRNYGITPRAILRLEREGERERFHRTGNHWLLWHGSFAGNYLSILSGGLKIAPPTAASTGLAFGRGIYFADCAAKSYPYRRSHESSAQGSAQGALLLCEVALGKIHEMPASEPSREAPPAGFDSCMAPGRDFPEPDGNLVLRNGVTVPYGKVVNWTSQQKDLLSYLQNKKVLSPSEHLAATKKVEEISKARFMAYNEYIVYSEAQVRLRYMIVF